MKKLNRLQINSEKLMKNEDLLALRGGYDGCSCICYNWDFEIVGSIFGAGITALTCNPECIGRYGSGFGHCA